MEYGQLSIHGPKAVHWLTKSLEGLHLENELEFNFLK